MFLESRKLLEAAWKAIQRVCSSLLNKSKNCEADQGRRVFSHYPLKIGDHVFVGAGSVVEAALVGSHVNIGANCVIGKFVIIKDFVRILEGTIVPANMVIPSFSIVAGRPGRVVGEVPEGAHESFDCREIYRTINNN